MRFDKIQDIVDFAISKEQEAMDFYTGLADKVKNPAVAEELRNMAGMEQRHRDWLVENSVSLASDIPSVPVADLMIADMTVEPKITDDPTWQDVVNLAMHREADAVQLYSSLSHLVSDPAAKQVFQRLANEESKHKLFFETIWDDEVLTED